MSARVPDYVEVSVRRHPVPALIATAALTLGFAACGTETKSKSHRAATPHPAAHQPGPSPHEVFARFQARTLQRLTATSIELTHKILDDLDRPGVDAVNYANGDKVRFGNVGTTSGTKPSTFVGYDRSTRTLIVSSLGPGNGSNSTYINIFLLLRLGPDNPLEHQFSGFTTDSFRRALANPADIQFVAANGGIDDVLPKHRPSPTVGVTLHKGTLYYASGLDSGLMDGSDPTQYGMPALTTQPAVNAVVARLKKILPRTTAQLGVQLAG